MLCNAHLANATSTTTDVQRKSARRYVDLKFFTEFLEASHQMELVNKTVFAVFERHLGADKWIEEQLLLFLKCETPFEFIFRRAEEIMQVLVEIGTAEWKPVLDRYRNWDSGRFDNQITFDAMMTDPAIESKLVEKVAGAFAQIVFQISTASYS